MNTPSPIGTPRAEVVQRLRMIRQDHLINVRKIGRRRKCSEAERLLAIKVENDDIDALTYAINALGTLGAKL